MVLLNATLVMLVSGSKSFFAPLALQFAMLQSPPPREILVVADTLESLPPLVEERKASILLILPNKSRHLIRNSQASEEAISIKAIVLEGPSKSIGEKRNVGCQEASSKFILHWDDDDFYSKRRTWHQTIPLMKGNANLSALTMTHVNKGLQVRQMKTRSTLMFASLSYTRHLCLRFPFPHVSLGEDQEFAETASTHCNAASVLSVSEAFYTRSRSSTSPEPHPITHNEDFEPKFPSFFEESDSLKWKKAFKSTAKRENVPFKHNSPTNKGLQFFPSGNPACF